MRDTAKTVLITGGAKRIGREIALRLGREGARVAIHYNGSREEAERPGAECGAAGMFPGEPRKRGRDPADVRRGAR